MLSAVYQQRCWKIVFLKASSVHETSLKASFVPTASTQHYQFGFRPLGARWSFSALALLGLATPVVNTLNCCNAERFRMHIKIYITPCKYKVTCTLCPQDTNYHSSVLVFYNMYLNLWPPVHWFLITFHHPIMVQQSLNCDPALWIRLWKTNEYCSWFKPG